jgi:ferredoxin-type protein NapH
MKIYLSQIKRIYWQVTGLLFFNFPWALPNYFAWLPVPVLNCYSCPLAQGACPIGTIQHFLVIGAIPLFALGVVGFFALMLGRYYCSHLCPFGFFQELLGKLRKKKLILPRWAGYGKYASLIILALILSPILKEPFFCTLCPAGTLEAGIPIVSGAWFESHFTSNLFNSKAAILGMVGWWFLLKLFILFSVIGLCIVIWRPFCRMGCPLGALLGLFNRISVFVHPPLEKQQTQSGFYLKNCPVHIRHPKDVDSHNCIKCEQCYYRPGEKKEVS